MMRVPFGDPKKAGARVRLIDVCAPERGILRIAPPREKPTGPWPGGPGPVAITLNILVEVSLVTLV